MNVNTAILIGNLTRDAEIRYTGTGNPVATFNLAVNEPYSVNGEEKKRVAFINCVAWGKLAEQVGQCAKGTRIFVEGRINTRNYDDQQTGKKVYVTEVVANFIGTPLEGLETEGGNFEEFAKENEREDIPF